MSNVESPAVRKTNHYSSKEEKARESLAAWKEYSAQEEATRLKTAKLREQRLAREASAATPTPIAKPAKKAAPRRASK